jgi:electron transfer flavoprotein alpha subunit
VLCVVAAESPRDFSIDDFVAALSKPLDVVETRQIEAKPQRKTRYRLPAAPPAEEKLEATPESAAELIRRLAGVAASAADGEADEFRGPIELIENAKVPTRDAAVFVSTPDHVEGAAAAAACASALALPLNAVVFGNPDEQSMRRIAASIPAAAVYFVSNPNLAPPLPDALLAALQSLWKDTLPPVLMAGTWANELLARFAKTFPRAQARYNVAEIMTHNGAVELVAPAFGGSVQQVHRVEHISENPLVMTVALRVGAPLPQGAKRVYHLPLDLEYNGETDEMAKILGAAAEETGAKSIADADFIIDVGYAIRNKENFDAIIAPLKKRLEEIGVRNVVFGGTRKVVEELKLLAPDQQIGQTGTAVNPRVIISIGVSGAPQHIDYIGEDATIIAFNKDPDAPLMTLNKRRARPKVVPIVGDLYELVPRFTAALKR